MSTGARQVLMDPEQQKSRQLACLLPTEASLHSCLEQELVLIHRGASARLSTAFTALSDLKKKKEDPPVSPFHGL